MSTSVSFCLFETPLGSAAIAWTASGICGLQLPDTDPARQRARVRRRYPHASESPPPALVAEAIELLVSLLSGQPADFGRVELDYSGVPDFDQQVYALTRTIHAGETITYGEIARRLGDIHLARDVGQALGRNPFPMVVPCHRVVSSDGRLGGFSAPGGVTTKQRLLAVERANVSWQLTLL
jgi:methylated-DNA-[protein]-cysteine S-methyltransferase